MELTTFFSNNLLSKIVGVVIVLSAFTISFISYKKNEEGNFKKALLLLVLVGFILRFYAMLDFKLHFYDERFHAVVAKNLIKHPLKPTLYETPVRPYDVNDWTGNHLWFSKPPFPLWLMTISVFFFGENEIAVRLPSLILSLIGILLMYKTGQLLWGEKCGWLAAFFYSIHGFLIEVSAGKISSDHIEMCFVFCIQASIFFLIKYYYQQKRITYFLASAFLLSAAWMSKLFPALIVYPIFFLFEIKKQMDFKAAFLKICVFLIISLSFPFLWYAYCYYEFPKETNNLLLSFLEPAIKIIHEHKEYPLYYIDLIRITFGELIYIPLVWLLYIAYKNDFDKKRTMLIVWIYIPLIGFSLASTKRPTYLLLSAPAFFLLSSLFILYLSELRTQKPWLKFLYKYIPVVILILSIRYSIERLKPLSNEDKNPQWVQTLKRMEKENPGAGVIFNCEHPIEAMFYTNKTAYSGSADEGEINTLKAKGFSVFVMDSNQNDWVYVKN